MSDEGLYPISEAADRTGLSVHRLRQWERRYGFPDPERTEGGHRRYREADLRALRTVKALVDDGVQPKAAIRRYRSPAETADTPGALADALTEAMLDTDFEEAADVLSRAHQLHPVGAVLDDVVAPALRRLGERWASGAGTIGEEHAATAFLRSQLGQLDALYGTSGHAEVLVATPPRERHEVGALMAAIRLERHGTPTLYLGADLPVDALAMSVRDSGALAVVLSALHGDPLDRLPEDAYRHVPVPVLVGGAAPRRRPEAVRRLGARPLTGTMDTLHEEVERVCDDG